MGAEAVASRGAWYERTDKLHRKKKTLPNGEKKPCIATTGPPSAPRGTRATQQHKTQDIIPYKAAAQHVRCAVSAAANKANNTVGIGTLVYSSSSESLDERPPLRSNAAMISLSNPSKPPPSETESEAEPDWGGGRFRLADCGVLRASVGVAAAAAAAATASAAAAAAAANEDRGAGAAGGAGDGAVRSTVVCTGAAMEAAACWRFVACARRPRRLSAADRAADEEGIVGAGAVFDVGGDGAAAGVDTDESAAVAAAVVGAAVVGAADVGAVSASAISSTTSGVATGGGTIDLVSPTTVTSSPAAAFPAAELSSMADTSSTSPKGGGATTLFMFCALAADASLAGLADLTSMPSVASIFLAW